MDDGGESRMANTERVSGAAHTGCDGMQWDAMCVAACRYRMNRYLGR